MIKKAVSVDDAVTFLNELLTYDENAVIALLDTRVPCGEELAEHPTVQVGQRYLQEHGYGWTVGFLGVLNGLFGTIEGGEHDGWGPISLVMAPNEPTRFELTDPPKDHSLATNFKALAELIRELPEEANRKDVIELIESCADGFERDGI